MAPLFHIARYNDGLCMHSMYRNVPHGCLAQHLEHEYEVGPSIYTFPLDQMRGTRCGHTMTKEYIQRKCTIRIASCGKKVLCNVIN